MESLDGRQRGRGSAYQFWPPPSSLWHVLLVGSLKASGLPSQAHSSPISLIKVRLTLPAWSQAGHTAFMLGHAHYSDVLAVPPRLQAAQNAGQRQPRDLGSLNFKIGQQKWKYKLCSFDTARHSGLLIFILKLCNGSRWFTIIVRRDAIQICRWSCEITSQGTDFECGWHKTIGAPSICLSATCSPTILL